MWPGVNCGGWELQACCLARERRRIRVGRAVEARVRRSWWWFPAPSVCAWGGGSPVRCVARGDVGRQAWPCCWGLRGAAGWREGGWRGLGRWRRESGKGSGGGDFRVAGRGCRPQSGAVVNHTFPETQSSVAGRGPAHTQFRRTQSRCCASPASSGPAVLSKPFPVGRGSLILPGPVCAQHGSPRVEHTARAQEG